MLVVEVVAARRRRFIRLVACRCGLVARRRLLETTHRDALEERLIVRNLVQLPVEAFKNKTRIYINDLVVVSEFRFVVCYL